MGKREKEHKAKVAKRNKKLGQEKYKMQNTLTKLMQEMAKQQNAEQTEKDLNISVGGSNLPFSVVTEEDLDSIVEFKEQNQEMFNIAETEIKDQDELIDTKNEIQE